MKLLSPVLFYISLTTRRIFLGPLCVALLHNWDFLPWLLRQRDCCWTSLVYFWEDLAFTCEHSRLVPLTLSCLFFWRLVFNGAFVFRFVMHLVDSSLTFLGPTLCVALLYNWDVLPWLLRQRYCSWTDSVWFWEDHAFSCEHARLVPLTLSSLFF